MATVTVTVTVTVTATGGHPSRSAYNVLQIVQSYFPRHTATFTIEFLVLVETWTRDNAKKIPLYSILRFYFQSFHTSTILIVMVYILDDDDDLANAFDGGGEERKRGSYGTCHDCH